MSEPLPTSPSLEYAAHPAVGHVVVHRAPDRMTLTLLPDRRRILVAVGVFGIWVLISATFFVFTMYFNPPRYEPWGLYVCSLLPLVAGAWQLAIQLIFLLNPIVLEVEPLRLVCSARKISAVVHNEYPRAQIADVRTDKLRLKDHLVRRRYLVIRLTNGQDLALLRASRKDLEFLAAQLREGLGLGPDPLGAARYPPTPSAFRGTMRLIPNGLVLTLAPRRWLIGLIAGGALGLAWLLLEPIVTAQRGWTISHDWTMPLLGAAAMGMIGGVIVVSASAMFRRSSALAVHDGRLILHETGLRPCHVEWTARELRQVQMVQPTSQGGPPGLAIIPLSGQTVIALQGERAATLEWIATCLQIALQLNPLNR
jgi:hypothetical protein